MIKLYMDVSTDIMYIALSKDNTLLDFSVRHGKRDHAKYLVDRIHLILEKNKLRLDDVNEIIVGEGPGSYTGIRIAVTVGKTFAYAKKIDLYRVSSLIFMSSGFDGLTCVIHDARRGFVFASIYEDGDVYLNSKYILLEELKKHAHYKKTNMITLDEETYKVDLSKIDLHRKLVVDVHSFEPNYSRLTEAEENAS